SEAISSPDSVEWQKAMSDEMAALVDNETSELVAKPKERSVIGGRWVYSVKSGPNDQEIFKARYVAKRYSQVADVDFTETFSPTARLTSVRMLMDIAVQKSYIVHQMHVCTAYLHAKIDCNVFVEQPEGFIELDKNGENYLAEVKACGGRLPIVEVSMSKELAMALVDTGCTMTVVHSRYVAQFDGEASISAFDGQKVECKVVNRVKIVVKGRMPVVTKALVSDRLVDGVDVVLGTDVIDRLGGVTVKRGRVEFGSARVEMACLAI
ncbi:Reverse transcriptase RNA-dependent DNA polymerase, partial [Trinorchestia longiramus]